MKIHLSDKFLVLWALPFLFIVAFYSIVSEKPDIESADDKFTILSNANTNYCAAADFLDSKSDDERLQGSCCSKMDSHRYAEQVEGLKQYSGINVIPSDPYDIEVSLAKTLVAFDREITLNAQEQETYDSAMKMSHEGGPCCCKCWRWTAFEGQAKYLITEYDFDAEQIAQVWDLEDGCGGKEHADHFEPKPS
jgi:hypothetical protein